MNHDVVVSQAALAAIAPAAPFREGSGWALRATVAGKRLYLSGQPSSRDALNELARLKARSLEAGKAAGHGPRQTTLAQALLDYALERRPFLKGADQEARRINR